SESEAVSMRINCPEKNKRRDASAFTIAEVLVSSSILVICFVSLYMAMGFGWSTIKDTREDLRATEIMLDKMEKIRLYSWLQATNTATYMNPAAFTETYNPNGSRTGQAYTVNVLLSSAPSGTPVGYQNNLKLVTVVVRWTNHYQGVPVAHARTNQ